MEPLKINSLAIFLFITTVISLFFGSCSPLIYPGRIIPQRLIYRDSQQVVDYLRQKGIEVRELQLMYVEKEGYRVCWLGKDARSAVSYALDIYGDFFTLKPGHQLIMFPVGDSFHHRLKTYTIVCRNGITMIKKVKNRN